MNGTAADAMAVLPARGPTALAAALGRVLGALELERASLTARDAEGLSRACEAKTEALAEAARLAAAGLAGETDELRELARRCRDLNEANGILIRGQRRQVDGALRILLGAGAGTELYGRDGSSRRLAPPRGPLASG